MTGPVVKFYCNKPFMDITVGTLNSVMTTKQLAVFYCKDNVHLCYYSFFTPTTQ